MYYLSLGSVLGLRLWGHDLQPQVDDEGVPSKMTTSTGEDATTMLTMSMLNVLPGGSRVPKYRVFRVAVFLSVMITRMCQCTFENNGHLQGLAYTPLADIRTMNLN